MISLPGQYTIERELGRGGMATVYLARDLKHDRWVALKVLHPELAATLGPERFQREIRFAARLQHPHILTVLDSGEAAGQLWFTMPYVEGESLRDRLRRERQLPVADALRIAREAAQALHYAHEHGVLHRDVKPENILLTRDGNTLVADFGVARALGGEGSLTETGITVGTPAYMSPEQAAGERELDARSDVYALGCVLYEMLAGEPPFTGPTAQAIIAKRFNTPVTPLRIVRPDLPDSVDQAVLRALARTPADRFASAAELAAALQDGMTSETAAARVSPGAPTPSATLVVSLSRLRRLPRIAALALTALVLAGAAWMGYRAARGAPGPAPLDTAALAVLPFRVVGPGLELWREGMVDLLSLNLDGAAGLRTIHPRTVLSRWHRELGNDAASADQMQALGVARATGARYALTGSIVGQAAGVRLIAELVEVTSGKPEGHAQVEGAADSVPALVDRLAIQLLERGFPDRSGRTAADVGGVTTRSLPALKSYLAGLQSFRDAQPQAASAAFRAAIQADSGFALAMYHLALADGWTGSPHGLGRGDLPALRQAFRHAERLPPRERRTVPALILASDGDVAALPLLRAVVKEYPDDSESWYLLGDALYHLGGAALEPAVAFRRALQRATELDSSFAPPYLHLAEDAFDRLDSAEARRLVSALRRIEPGSTKTTGLGIMYGLVWGTTSERQAARLALDTATAFAVLTAKHATNLTPDLWEQTLLVGRALANQSRHPASLRSQGMHGIAIVYEIRGRVREAVAQWRRTLAFDGTSGPGLDAYDHVLMLPRMLGAPHDSADLRRAYDWLRGQPDTLGDWLSPFLGGLYAASHGQVQETERWLRLYADLTRRDLQASDTAGARRGQESMRVIRAYLAESRGDSGAVLRELRRVISVYPGNAGTESVTGMMLRFDLVRRLVVTRDFTTAERYLGSFERWGMWPSYFIGPIELLRGRVAEGLNDPDNARTRYANVARWWKDCDPDLAPVRDEAREALARLTAESNGAQGTQ